MVTCKKNEIDNYSHNPYFSRRFFAIQNQREKTIKIRVTILILVEGSLQFNLEIKKSRAVRSQSLFQQKVLCNHMSVYWRNLVNCHNPYFSRRFFAIRVLHILPAGYHPSQSLFQQKVLCNKGAGLHIQLPWVSHNPYFSRRFFAIF